MDELELLKKDWNKDSEEFKSFTEDDIFKMIRKNSISVSKSLLMIGILEIIFWFLFYYLDYHGKVNFLNWQLLLRSFLFVFFIFFLIYFFLKIRIESDSKKLMRQIILLRRIIIGYVVLMLFSIFLFNILDFQDSSNDVIRGWVDGWNAGNYDPKNNINTKEISPWFGYIGFIFTFLVGIIILLFIYKELYGNLLKKLKSNYKELSKLEESNT